MIPLDDHDDILAAIKKLAGMKLEPASKEVSSCGCAKPCDCEMVEEETDGAPLANTPADPIAAMADEKNTSIADTQPTGHTPNNVVPTRGPADNPYLNEENKSEEIDQSEVDALAESLSRDWQKTKLAHIAESFNVQAAERAIVEGKDNFTHNYKQYVIRKDKDLIKVYPVLEGRIMTQVPLYVIEAGLLPKLVATGALATAGLAAGMGGMDKQFYENPRIQAMVQQIDTTSDPMKKKELEDQLAREKDFWEAKGRLRVPSSPEVKEGHAGLDDDFEKMDMEELKHEIRRDVKNVIDFLNQFRTKPLTKKDLDTEQGETAFNVIEKIIENPRFAAQMFAQVGVPEDQIVDIIGKARLLQKSSEKEKAHVHEQNVVEVKKKKNPYAIGMAAAKKSAGYGSKPTHDLPKSVVTKAHEIAKKIKNKK